MKSASSRVYTDSSLSYTEVLQAIEAAKLGEVQTFSVKSKTELPNLSATAKVFLVLLDAPKGEDNLDLIEALDGKITKNPVSMSMVVGYGKIKAESRNLQETNQTTTTKDSNVNATATGALMISLLVTLITVFGMVMMANIQTPKSFARRDLIKGRINK